MREAAVTIEQALEHLESDRHAIERAMSDLQTVKALRAVGEEEHAFNLYAQIRHRLIFELRW